MVLVMTSIFLIFTCVIPGIGAYPERNGRALKEITWSGAVDLTENLTIERDQRLVISEGTNITLGRDVHLTIEGEIDCGGIEGRTVNIINAQDRLSGGVVLINCAGASFINTRFTGMALAVESIYSTLTVDACDLNNSGIGFFCFESRLHLSDTDLTDCDMAGRFVRSSVFVSECFFSDNLQSLMIHNDLEMIGAYYRNEIAEIGKLHNPLVGGLDMTSEISGCSFTGTGIGISMLSSGLVSIDSTSFILCKKGIHGELSPGRITNCSFHGNKVDYEITGRDMEVLDSITPPVNFTLYLTYNIEVTDDGGEPVSDTELRISHPDLANMTYRTDENGTVSNIPLLQKKSIDGTVTIYSGYNVTLKNEDFEGYYPLGNEEDILITPSDMITEEGDELIPVDREAGLVLVGILVIAVVVIIVRRSLRKGKGRV